MRVAAAIAIPIGVAIAALFLDFYPEVEWISALAAAIAVSVWLFALNLDRPYMSWPAAVVFGAAAGVAITWFVFFDFPRLVVPAGLIPKNAVALVQRRNEVRTAAVQAALGIAVVVGAIYTARTFRITRESHFTDRLSTAVSQLNQGTDVATGAVVALERLAADSRRDRLAVLELLTSYVQTHAQEPATQRVSPGPPRQRLIADVQAALTAITRLIPSVSPLPRLVDLSELNLRGAGFEVVSSLADLDLSSSDLSGAQLRNVSGRGASLTQADLSEAVANGVDLFSASMGGALLLGTKLDGANLSTARLPGARLDGAFISGANLERADLSNAVGDRATILERADLTAATLIGAQLLESELREARLVGAHLEAANLSRAQLELGNLRGAFVSGTNFSGARLRGADLSGVIGDARTSFEGAHLEEAQLIDVELRGARLTDAHLESANLAGAHLEGAHLEGANLAGAHLEGANLAGAHLDGADLTSLTADTNLTGAHWSTATSWPAELADDISQRSEQDPDGGHRITDPREAHGTNG